MQPAREFDIYQMWFFTGILLLAVLFALSWLIYIQEQIDWWFSDLGSWAIAILDSEHYGI